MSLDAYQKKLNDYTPLDLNDINDPRVIQARKSFPIPITQLEAITDKDLQQKIFNDFINTQRIVAFLEKERATLAQQFWSEKENEKQIQIASADLAKMKESMVNDINSQISAKIAAEGYALLQKLMENNPEVARIMSDIMRSLDNIKALQNQIQAIQQNINALQQQSNQAVQNIVNQAPVFQGVPQPALNQVAAAINNAYDQHYLQQTNLNRFYAQPVMPPAPAIGSVAYAQFDNANDMRFYDFFQNAKSNVAYILNENNFDLKSNEFAIEDVIRSALAQKTNYSKLIQTLQHNKTGLESMVDAEVSKIKTNISVLEQEGRATLNNDQRSQLIQYLSGLEKRITSQSVDMDLKQDARSLSK